MRAQTIVGLVLSLVLLWSGIASAQSATTGAIGGVVRDGTAAVLPGVTVEAASPALIERVRTVVTDGQGRYQIVELPPGAYTVTFSLTGFSAVRREGIELTTGFTATANAELSVGSLEETITVSGASPLVDIRNVRTQKVISREVLDVLPTGKTFPGYVSLTVGASAGFATQDVGGSRGEGSAALAIHGSRPGDTKLLMDGMRYNSPLGTSGGQSKFYVPNPLIAEEIVLETGGISAEGETAGIQINMVPKDGGNVFRGDVDINGSGPALQGSNLTVGLRARGLTATPGVKKIYGAGGNLGGPIKKARLWFFTAHRWWGSQEFVPGNYFDKTPDTLFYTADLSRPAYFGTQPVQDHTVRLTWQASAKNKFTFFESSQDTCFCYLFVNANRAPEAGSHSRAFPMHLPQVTWTYAATNRLLVQAGTTYLYNNFSSLRPREQAKDAISVTELSTGYVSKALATFGGNDYADNKRGDQVNGRFSVSYISGSHAFKTGFFFYVGGYNNKVTLNEPPVAYEFRNAKPVSIVEWASPHKVYSMVENLGLHAQDQWTLRRLTLNLGVRLDFLRAWNPEQTRPGGLFVPELRIARVDNVPNWKDISPRLGGAYDLFGNGKTALKGSLGRYVIGEGATIAFATNPAAAIVQSARRLWNDGNGNYIPDCDLTNPAENDECGALSNNLFGTVQINTRYADKVLNGFAVRPYEWQGTVSLQHELRPGLELTVGYFRTSYSNFLVTSNVALTPASFDSYCITVPKDPRLPDGGGNQLCGLYDVKPTEFGKVSNLVTQASDFGKQTEVYNGVDILINARVGKGGVVSGGVNTGRTVTDFCYQNDAPQLIAPVLPNYTAVPAVGGGQGSGNTPRLPAFCRATLPLKGQTQVKFAGSYPLPWDFEASAVFQNLSMVPINAAQSFTNDQIAPSLGRNLAACGAATTCTAAVAINLIPPYTQFEDRLTQIDLRLTKIVRFGRVRLKGMFELYNAFNANTILVRNDTFGPTWGRPTQILSARLFKLGAQVQF